jgi:hypothetical protein
MIELLARVCGPLRQTDQNLCEFYMSGKPKKSYANNPVDPEALKQNISEAVYNI